MKVWGPRRDKILQPNAMIALEAAARLGSFNAAAKELGLTQGAIAQQIRSAEADIGFELFERQPRGLSPTPACLTYAEVIRQSLTQISLATNDLLQKQNGQAATSITVSASPTLASKWLIPRLKEFSEKHPTLSVRVDASETVRPLGGHDGVDLAIRWGKPPFKNAREKQLLPGDLVPICSSAFKQQHGLKSPRDIADLPLISDSHDLWPRWLELNDVSPSEAQELKVSQTGLAIESALHGLGIALVPLVFVADDLKAGHLIRAFNKTKTLAETSGFYLLMADRTPPPSVAKMWHWLLAEARKDKIHVAD